ncbi:MAG: AAA family ATPase [Acidimicrobiales bacterium]
MPEIVREVRTPARPRIPPHDLAVEAHLLGAALLRAEAATVVAGVDPAAWYSPAHGHIAFAVTELVRAEAPVDSGTVAAWLRTHGLIEAIGGEVVLVTLMAECPSTTSAAWLAERLAELCARRSMLATASDITEALYTGLDVSGLVAGLGSASAASAGRDPDPSLPEFLADEEESYNWVVPGLLEWGDRLILTGVEGQGKSTLLRQIGVQCAAGIHPFTMEPIEPRRVWILDLENARRHVRRELRPLKAAARGADLSGCLVQVRPEGLDLLSVADQGWLARCLAANKPDLVITGPVYKLASGDPTEEKVARAVALTLDRMRAEFGFALILEAHSPHATPGAGKRPERPYGASLWMRWPEFGLHLSPEGSLRHWRGPRDQREWPVALRRGGAWPWTPGEPLRATSEDQDRSETCMEAMARWFRAHPEAAVMTRNLTHEIPGFRAEITRQTADILAEAGVLDVEFGPKRVRRYRLARPALTEGFEEF